MKQKRSEDVKKKISQSMTGHLVSNETRRKISDTLKNTMQSPELRNRISESLKGRKASLETRKKMSLIRSGSKSYLWKGGITKENQKIRTNIEFRLWRESVFARDGWTCQKYKIKGGILHAHHIKNFAQYTELRFAIDNGITLSKRAHKEFHLKYGKVNNTQEQIDEFLSIDSHK